MWECVLAIDPGPKESAWLVYDGQPRKFGKVANFTLLEMCRHTEAKSLCIEQIEGMGMAVGQETFETVWWAGRFHEAFPGIGARNRLTRRAVKLHLCGSMKAKDANVRQALVDRWGGDSVALNGKRCSKAKNKSHGRDCPICGGSGWERSPGPLAGISEDCWSALAIAVTFWDLHNLG